MSGSMLLPWLVVTLFLVETFTIILVVSGFSSSSSSSTAYPPACSSRGSSVVAVSSLTATPLQPVVEHEAEDGPNPPASSSSSSSYPWRIVLDIGREPLARMPFAWARQGARMPLVVPSNFTLTTTGRRRVVHVHGAGTVGFTDTGGAQESTIQAHDWNVQHDTKNHRGVSSFSFSYTIEQDLTRRDVYIEAGTELFLSTLLYTQSDLDELNAQYVAAREQIWSKGEKLNNAAYRQAASKQWNTQTERWEPRYPTENPITAVQEQIAYWWAKFQQQQARRIRPEPDTLSDRGGKLPGRIRARSSAAAGAGSDDEDDDEGVYLVQPGIIRYGNEKGPICGRWTGQPMTNVPAWERGQGR